jgi:hypothetical protein
MGKFCVLFSISITLLSSGVSLADSERRIPGESLSLSSTASSTGGSKIYDQLDANQKARIQSGQYLEFTQFFQGEAWPQIVVIQRVNATPEEAMAVLADFASQSRYVYRVKSSIVHPTNDPRVVIVDYRLDLSSAVSTVFDPQYRVQNRLVKGADGSYQISWNLVSSRDISRLEGRATFEPLPGGGTLIYYSTFMTPRLDRNFIVVRLLKSQKVVDAIVRGGWKALASIVAQIENLKINRPSELQADVERFRNILP